MSKTQKNYLIYALMLFLFGGMIYAAIQGGGHLLDADGRELVADEVEALEQFASVVKSNLHHPLTILLLQIIIVLTTVHLFNFLFKRIGQPGVIGEIVAGIVLGPSLLGYYFPGAFHFVFPAESLTNLELVSQIGLILFMFVIGLELDFSVLRKKIDETLVISHAGILIPFFLGILASYWVYEEYAAGYTDFLPFSLFMGISMSITAFPVLARIIQERNMSKTSVGILSIASAANDDVTAWCLLAVVIAIVKAGTFVGALYTILLTVVYIVVMFGVVRPVFRRVGEVYANRETINKLFVGSVFLLLVISAAITELLGIHALFGAFVAGVIMPPNLNFRKIMMLKIEDVAVAFFLPLFFAFTGLRTEIGLINTPELWLTCLLLIVVAVAGKLGGCTLAARMVGSSWKDSLTIGTLMNTRGLMELVALNIGYEMGVLPPAIFVILVLMALITTFMTTPLLHFIDFLFAGRVEKLSLKNKLLLSFGRPDSGANLLHIFHLLYGKELKKTQVIAAHYTVGTDVSPLNAGYYEQESFREIDEMAEKLQVSLERKYKVTDRLVAEMVELTQKEKPSMLLLGAGVGYETDKAPIRGTSIFSLFRDKVRGVTEQVECPVGVFINHHYRQGEISLVISGIADYPMMDYLQRLVKNGNRVNLCLYRMKDEEFVETVRERISSYTGLVAVRRMDRLTEVSEENKEGLLFISEPLYKKISDEEVISELPSLLIISDKNNQI